MAAPHCARQARMSTSIWLRDQPLWKQERARRRELRKICREAGVKLARLQSIFLVELDRIYVPAWARAKAIKGLTVTNTTVWLKRIAATKLAELDREAGGNPRLTASVYRRCHMCQRALLGAEAEARFELDRMSEGHRLPCGPECIEFEKARKQRHGRAAN